jgi:hypothetical protein
MKKTKHHINLHIISIAIVIMVSALFIASCDSSVYPAYKYGIGQEVPDSLKDDLKEFIVKTVSATNQQMSGGDYEDPEDVIATAEDVGTRLYAKPVEGLYVKDNSQSWWEFKSKKYLTKNELDILENLKGGK